MIVTSVNFGGSNLPNVKEDTNQTEMRTVSMDRKQTEKYLRKTKRAIKDQNKS